jgi:F-type H+-transporting ATPase subunit b
MIASAALAAEPIAETQTGIEVSDATHGAVAAGHGPFYQDPTFWVAVGFLLFVALLWRMGVHRQIAGGLDERAAKIKAQLDEAARLRADAERLLADAEARAASAEADAAAIVAQARAQAAAFAQKAERDLADTIARRTRQAEDRIAAAERAAEASLRAQTADLAARAAARAIAADADAALQASLADRAIEDVARRLN